MISFNKYWKKFVSCQILEICPVYGVTCTENEDGNIKECTGYPCTKTYECKDNFSCTEFIKNKKKFFDCYHKPIINKQNDSLFIYTESKFCSKYKVHSKDYEN